MPCCGWFQRTSASAEVATPSAMRKIGWKLRLARVSPGQAERRRGGQTDSPSNAGDSVIGVHINLSPKDPWKCSK